MSLWPSKVRDFMTVDPVWSDPDSSVERVAGLMSQKSCGEVPVVEHGKVIGVVTDRDITCRVVALGLDPKSLPIRSIMTMPAVTVRDDCAVTKALFLMQEKNVRRLPVVNEAGMLVGVLSQVDIANRVSETEAGHLLKRESERMQRLA